ncbi:MAG: UvrD-helicase domain-containing protein [Paludibacteraceae bacterium]|nr:UvrD-helicase domain-containing protein [Paludibacteraceae bacterium]
MNPLLSELNESQAAAVAYNEGPSLVIAGAGSGKTRVLTYKIAYLLASGVKANNILALTFTNKAAREMRERITQLVDPSLSRYLWMGTFHSICARILRQESDRLGFTRDFSIYDSSDSKSLVKQLIKERELDDKVYKPSVVLSRISSAKNQLVTPESYALDREISKRDRNDRLYEMANLYHFYQLRLRGANAMDFDDLLVNVCRLLDEYPEVREYYQDIFQYVLVDEYQDTNFAQYVIVRQLAAPQNKICVVGDDAQSIYSFRGADIRNILSFQREYRDAKLFKLERNYRSTQTIVKAANSLIHHNENQIYKEVYSEKEEGDRIQLASYASDREEAEGVAASIGQLHRATKRVSYDDMAILYRTNAQSRVFENELRRLNIPYRIYGGTSFYQRKEIKDAICYFRLVANPKDNEALLRVINFPARKIGESTIRKVAECAALNNVSMFDVVQQPSLYSLALSSAPLHALAGFASIISQFMEQIDTLDAYEFADSVLRLSGVMAAAAADKSTEGIDRKQNLDELLSGIHEFVMQRQQEGISYTPIHDFLAEVSLLTDQDEHLEDHTSRVSLMTVHAAKGLEYPVVFIVGMEENLFPSQFCDSPSEIEEERRLLYVAITRAMERCSITYAKSRFRNGSVNFSSPSRFLKDIDRKYICKTESASSRSSFDPTNGFFPRWQNSSWEEPESSVSAVRTETKTPRRLSPVSSVPSSATSSLADYPFAKGDRVAHRIFGNGLVQRVYSENGNDKIDILFDGPGAKTLLLTYAKLEKIQS